MPRYFRYYSCPCLPRAFANDSHHTSEMWHYFSLGNQPLYERGVRTALLDDDGSPAFADLYAQAMVAPVLTRG